MYMYLYTILLCLRKLWSCP